MNPERVIPDCGIPGCKTCRDARPKDLSWSDVHDGDIITVRCVRNPRQSRKIGDEFTGPAYYSVSGFLTMMRNLLNYDDSWALVRIEKRALTLPTEAGAVLLDVTIDGVAYHAAVRDNDGTWFVPTRSSDGKSQWVDDCAIESYVTSYTP